MAKLSNVVQPHSNNHARTRDQKPLFQPGNEIVYCPLAEQWATISWHRVKNGEFAELTNFQDPGTFLYEGRPLAGMEKDRNRARRDQIQ